MRRERGLRLLHGGAAQALAVALQLDRERAGPVASVSRSKGSTWPSTAAVPITGWPANGSSRRGREDPHRGVPSARSAGVTNVVSDRLVSRAIRCIATASSPRASVKTQSAFPASGRPVNTSH